MISPIHERVCRSLNRLFENYVETFLPHAEFTGNADINRDLLIQIDAFERLTRTSWFKATGLEDLTVGFETILTTVEMVAPQQNLAEIARMKQLLRNLFLAGAVGIRDVGIANLEDQQQQMKQNFMSDLYSKVVNDIKKELLLESIEPVHVFGNPKTLNALLYKTHHGGENARPPREYPRERLHWRQRVNNNKMVQVYKIYERVARRLEMPLERLIQHLINKKHRNREVHQAAALISAHLERQPVEPNEPPRLSAFIQDSIFVEPATFTDGDTQESQLPYLNFVRSAKLGWKER